MLSAYKHREHLLTHAHRESHQERNDGELEDGHRRLIVPEQGREKVDSIPNYLRTEKAGYTTSHLLTVARPDVIHS